MGFKEYCGKETCNHESSKIEEERVEDLYNKYKDKNEDELIIELIKNVEKQKRDGTFKYDALIKTLEKLRPFLTKEQNEKIKEILKKIQ